MFNKYGWFTGALPADCVTDCSASGPVDEAVAYWRKKLHFEVPRELAIRYLAETGAWPRESDKYDTGLNAMSDEDLAEKVLWLACCEIRESGDWLGLVH